MDYLINSGEFITNVVLQSCFQSMCVCVCVCVLHIIKACFGSGFRDVYNSYRITTKQPLAK